MNVFLKTVGFSAALLLGITACLTWINGWSTRRVVQHRGKANSQLWLMKPGIFIHEALHAAVGMLFGLHVADFSLKADQRTNSAAHVTFSYNKRSLWQRIGMFFSAGAPVWGISLILLLLGKKAWFSGVAWQAISLDTLNPNWHWVIGWLVASILLTFGASLSGQDWRNLFAGGWFALLLVLLGFGLCLWLQPHWLLIWFHLNLLASGGAVLMLLAALVVNLLLILI